MGDLLVCRVCLSTNVKLYDMYENGLVFPYESLTGIKISKLTQFSHRVCGACSTLLNKWITFKTLCQNSQDLILFAQQQNHVVTEDYIQSLELKTHILDNLTIVRDTVKLDYVVYDNQIKEEISGFNNTELKWVNYSSDEEPLSKQSGKKAEIKEEYNIKAEDEDTNCKIDSPGHDDGESDNDVQDLREDNEVDLLILTKEQQQEEMTARMLSWNYLNSFYKCDKCFKGFMRNATYKNHMTRHDSSKGELVCDLCHTYWPSISSLKSHTASAHERKYICRLCSHVSKSKHRANEHFKWHSGHKFVCKICGSVFEKSTSHLTHLRLHHPSEHSCDICGESFVSDKGLSMHKKKTHGQVFKNDTSKEECFCSICDTQFQSLEALKKHTEDDENVCIDTRSCVHCGENFKNEFNLKEHLKTHSKDGPTQCEECDKSFINERAYARHYQRIHLRIITKNYGEPKRKVIVVCEICGKKCLNKAALLCHQRTHTGEKPFQCTYCPKKFSVYQRLQIHLRVHTGEAPYKCSHCPKAFKNKAALNRHCRVHTGEKPYSCSHCGKCFSQSNSMKVHVKTVHLKMPAPYKSRQRQPKTVE